MKICFLSDGDSVHTKRWCNYFFSLGHEIHLITFKNTTLENTEVHFVNAGNIDVKGGNWKILFSVGKIKKILQKIKPEILHAHYATSYGLVGALSGFHPFVITALGSDVLISPNNSFIYRNILKYVFKKADWITVVAEHMREKMIRLGSDESKTETIIFGIDFSIFNLNERNLSDKKFIITSTRNFEPVYNIQYLLEAIAIAKGQIPDLHLNLIGSGTLQNDLENFIKKKNLSSVVTFFGKVNQDVLAKTLKESHLFVTVSLSDGNNVSLNEAMACGALCIASDIPANQQWIQDGENGFLVPLNNVNYLAEKIIAVRNSYSELSTKFIPLSTKSVSEKGDWKKNMKRVEKKYLELVNHKF